MTEPTNDDLERDLAALDWTQQERDAQLAGVRTAAEKVETERLAELARDRATRRERRARLRTIIAGWLLALGLIAVAVFGCVQWYQYERGKTVARYLAWNAQCEQAGGTPVGVSKERYCTFPSGATLPYDAEPVK